MNLIKYVSQYKNVELCQKWDNNIPANELQDSELMLLLDSEIRYLQDAFMFLQAQDITGALVSIRDGDYKEVYVTESSRPYALTSIYHPIDYYL